jgi:hypothetical protein
MLPVVLAVAVVLGGLALVSRLKGRGRCEGIDGCALMLTGAFGRAESGSTWARRLYGEQD